MALTLELSPELEKKIVLEAERAGIKPAVFAAIRLQHDFLPYQGITEESDTDLLKRISAGMPDAFWQHYDDLTRKRDRETLTKEEQSHLIEMSDELEQRSADRLVWLAELASRRGTSLRKLMDDLELVPRKA